MVKFHSNSCGNPILSIIFILWLLPLFQPLLPSMPQYMWSCKPQPQVVMRNVIIQW